MPEMDVHIQTNKTAMQLRIIALVIIRNSSNSVTMVVYVVQELY